MIITSSKIIIFSLQLVQTKSTLTKTNTMKTLFCYLSGEQIEALFTCFANGGGEARGVIH